jgi:hypothetical protein
MIKNQTIICDNHNWGAAYLEGFEKLDKADPKDIKDYNCWHEETEREDYKRLGLHTIILPEKDNDGVYFFWAKCVKQSDDCVYVVILDSTYMPKHIWEHEPLRLVQ